MTDLPPRNTFERCINGLVALFDAPVIWFREKIVEPNRPTYYWYHKVFRRVPTIDECAIGDQVCYYEANEQFKRDRNVDSSIIQLLRERKLDCYIWHNPNHLEVCAEIAAQFEEAQLNWFIKYGDLGATGNCVDCYMKQKHRLIWERRQAEKKDKFEEFN